MPNQTRKSAEPTIKMLLPLLSICLSTFLRTKQGIYWPMKKGLVIIFVSAPNEVYRWANFV